MHILFVSDNFPPETNAPATRLIEHARVWVRLGHRVTVVTCAPNFPEGRVYPGYSNDWYRRETVDGIDVVRVKTFIAPNRGFAARILDYVSFMVAGTIAALLQRQPDVVVATSPQFFAAVSGWLVAALRRKPFVFELRDLWPESIKAVGAMRQSLAIRALERLELLLYRRAKLVVAVTESFKRNLVSRGIDGEKISVIRNGVDLTRYAPRVRDERLAERFGVAGKFVVGYLGTHGMAHALHRVVEAAELLRDKTEIHFLFVGGGAARDELIALARSKALSNISFHVGVTKEEMPAVWSVCDAGLVHLKRDDLFATVIPSKIFECFGMGVPVLYCGPDGEAAAIVRAANAGLTLPAESSVELAEAVSALADQPSWTSDLATNAHAAAPLFDRERNAIAMLDGLLRVVGPSTIGRVRDEHIESSSRERSAA